MFAGLQPKAITYGSPLLTCGEGANAHSAPTNDATGANKILLWI